MFTNMSYKLWFGLPIGVMIIRNTCSCFVDSGDDSHKILLKCCRKHFLRSLRLYGLYIYAGFTFGWTIDYLELQKFDVKPIV